ncbi:unnamed protein product [Macrosiphum euphorbiae]|uniref:Uncharacterized protein n=1 Tax=Macrosiphum euphorbiae TaxID=13131 RepID=A0AAV0VY53_9HEMI|nr:unnamed protein product [Macrosiphum euphorbiae]
MIQLRDDYDNDGDLYNIYSVPKENGHFLRKQLTAAALQRPKFSSPFLANNRQRLRETSASKVGNVGPLHCCSRKLYARKVTFLFWNRV